MLNDRDEKYDAPDDGEYHFSDEDAGGYEGGESGAQVEATKQATEAKPKEGLVAKLTQSRRMLISGVVFLVLVFVVYKMVAPTSSTQSTEITAMTANAPAATAPKAPTRVVTQTVTTKQPMNAPEAPPQMTVPTTPEVAPTQTTVTTVTGAPSAPTMPPAAPPGVTPAAPVVTQTTTTTNNVAPLAPTAPGQVQNQPIAQTEVTQTTTTTSPASPPPLIAQPTPANVANNIEAGVTNMAANSERLMTQLQAQYEQKMNSVAEQNKNLEAQMETLTTRVTTVEAELAQLVQTLTHAQQVRNSINAMNTMPPPTIERETASEPPRATYSVQAIIPGRAWLKNDSGETVTVAEGDVLKHLGKVTKIDPYNGIIEVNVGNNKTITLTYGNGG